MDPKKRKTLKKRHIFIISLILHIIALILLFFFFKYSVEDVFLKKEKKQAKVIFKKPKPKPKAQPPKPKPKPKQALPAFQGLKTGTPKAKPIPKEKKPKPTIKKEEPKKELIKPKEKKILKKPEPKKRKILKKLAPANINIPKKQEPKKLELPKPIPKQKQTPITLKDISKGFLDYSQKHGANLIQYIGKTSNQAPTDKQIRKERYYSKIFDCMHQLFKIKKNTVSTVNRFPLYHQFVVDLGIIMNSKGFIEHIQVLNGCGETGIDNFIANTIKESSSSFAPPPSYIQKQDLRFRLRWPVYAGSILTRSCLNITPKTGFSLNVR